MRPGKALFTAGSVLVLALVLGGCSKAVDPWEKAEGTAPPRVLVTFPPLYCFVKNVAGDDAQILCLRTGVGPHDFKPDSQDLLMAKRADLFLANGLTLDDFVTNIANNSMNKNKDFVHKVGDAIPKNKLITNEGHGHDHGHAHGAGGHDHDHGEHNPHVWLGIDQATVMVNRICDLLQEKNPAKKDAYRARADKYIAELKELETKGKALLKDKSNRKIVTNHDSFGYFARSFGLECVDSIQVQPGISVDGPKLQKLINECQKQKVRVIGVEPQYSHGNAEALQKALAAKGADIQIVTLDPLETADQLTPDFYTKGMWQNLQNLADHLK